MKHNPFQNYVRFRSRGIAVGLMVLASAGVLGTTSGVRPVWAQGKAPAASATPTFASVDVQKVLTDYKARADYATQFTALQQNLSNVLRRLDQGSSRFLTDAEIHELGGLYEKATPTDADKKRIGALEQKGDTSSASLTRLQNVATPDDAQKKQLADLTDAQQGGNASLTKIKDEFQDRLNKRGGDLEQKALGEVRAAVAKVAQDKGYSVVFTADIAVYATNDITADVLKQLNK